MTYPCGHRTDGGLIGQCPICIHAKLASPDVFECVKCGCYVQGYRICAQCHEYWRIQKVFDKAKR